MRNRAARISYYIFHVALVGLYLAFFVILYNSPFFWWGTADVGSNSEAVKLLRSMVFHNLTTAAAILFAIVPITLKKKSRHWGYLITINILLDIFFISNIQFAFPRIYPENEMVALVPFVILLILHSIVLLQTFLERKHTG